MTDDAPWLDDEQLYSWMQLAVTITQLPAIVDAQLRRDSNLNFFEYSILAALSDAPCRAMRLSSLAMMANGSQSRLSHAVSRLERAGWVQRRNCQEGARSVEAVLTEAGHAKIVEAAPPHVREVRRMVVDTLTAEEMLQMRTVLRKILLAASPESVEFLDENFARRSG